jgi:hypothetical protein
MTVQVTMLDDEGVSRAGDWLSGLPTPVAPAEVDTGPRYAAIRDSLRLLEANRRLRAVLARNAAITEASIARLVAGADPGYVLTDVDVSGSRADLSDALDGFERARHRARSTFIAAQFGTGMNMKEIGSAWGISRQLAHRFFNESRRDR